MCGVASILVVTYVRWQVDLSRHASFAATPSVSREGAPDPRKKRGEGEKEREKEKKREKKDAAVVSSSRAELSCPVDKARRYAWNQRPYQRGTRDGQSLRGNVTDRKISSLFFFSSLHLHLFFLPFPALKPVDPTM